MQELLKHLRRHRTLFLVLGSALAIGLSLTGDPDHGQATYQGFVSIVQGIIALAIALWARKALMDYPEADHRKLFSKASESPIGSGLALLAAAVVFVGLLLVFAPRAHAAEALPAGFAAYGPLLKAEQVKYWPGHPDPASLAALVEQETCPSPKSAKCWNPSARLKSQREEGAGFGQITRAFYPDGRLRFDSLESMRRTYPDALGEWSWSNVYERPDLQMRGVVLGAKDAANPFRKTEGWLDFGDAAYNGGGSGLERERRACAATPGCVSTVWWGNVENHCLKSHAPLYGGRSACDINREHVLNVRQVRRVKYIEAMK